MNKFEEINKISEKARVNAIWLMYSIGFVSGVLAAVIIYLILQIK